MKIMIMKIMKWNAWIMKWYGYENKINENERIIMK